MLDDLGPLLRLSWALDRQRSGRDGPRLAASLLMLCEKSEVSKKGVSPRRERYFEIPQGQEEAKMELRWDQVGLCWAWSGPMLLMLAQVEGKVAHVGPG